MMFDAQDSLSFVKLFKGMFPERSKDVKMLVLTDNGKLVGSAVLFIESLKNSEGNPLKKVCHIGDIRFDPRIETF